MKNKPIVLLILVIALSVSFSGCKSKKKLTKRETKEQPMDKAIGKVLDENLEYRTLEIKGSGKTNANGKKIAISLLYRNVKDEKIWISARAMLGVEVGRVYCTPDSVWIISRIASIKEKGSWKAMEDLLGYPIDFYTLQGLMSRSMFVPGSPGVEAISQFVARKSSIGQLFVADYSDISIQSLMKKSGFMPQFLVHNGEKRLSRTKIAPEDSAWLMELRYEGSSNLPGNPISERLNISAVESKEQVSLDLKVQHVKLDQELKMPFSWF